MSLFKTNLQPTDRQLRQFGLISLFALPLLGWLWSGGNTTAIGVTAAIGAALAAIGLLWPKALKPVFLTLTLAAMPIGMAVGELTMILIFFGMFVPLGLFFRLIGRDALERKIDRHADTYWQPKKQPADAAGYLRQW